MSTDPGAVAVSGAATVAPSDTRATAGGVALMLTGGLSNQIGAGLGAHAFAAVGPAAVVAVRQVVAAAVLLAIARPQVRALRWPQWRPVLLLAITVSTMNLTLYLAIDRIGLGLAVSLEFLGPLLVAMFASRRRADLIFVVIAGAGVYILVWPSPSTDYLGVGLGLIAAAGWASYIVLNRVVGTRLPGLDGAALATTGATLIYLPVLVLTISAGKLTGSTLWFTIGAGVLASAVPYAVDLLALRRVPTGLFAIFTSFNPVGAAIAGMVVLGQFLGLHEWLGIALISGTNIAVIARSRGRRPPSDPAPEQTDSPMTRPVVTTP
ncbi:inner membrane transporter RhtA [Williamsia limnetica]|uniref:Inner membrane transporter RhtA n=1 Tax=Williamsia limnetica TaxID=882452 RepID=A0A318RS55_WILLI|nr:EamA family transporter [Williamsia limnetica]PYE18603.1 inner membrane transporter RhtA [Williamsia limnetica]